MKLNSQDWLILKEDSEEREREGLSMVSPFFFLLRVPFLLEEIVGMLITFILEALCWEQSES